MSQNLPSTNHQSRVPQILWANFEKAICLTDRATADQILTDLDQAKAKILTAFLTVVADDLRQYLEGMATQAESVSDISELTHGTLFVYRGSASGKGFRGLGSDQTSKAGKDKGRIQIGSSHPALNLVGEARLSHCLVTSVDGLNGKSSNKYIMALRGEDSSFIPLLLGNTIFDLDLNNGQKKAKYRQPQLTTSRDFADHVIDIFRNQMDTTLLWTLFADESETSMIQGEKKFQRLFELVCNVAKLGFDVSIDPQPNHGSGNLDLCVSQGNDACCIELKLSSNKKLKQGLLIQLPEYMRSKGTVYGRYLVLCEDGSRSPEEVSAILDPAKSTLPSKLNISVTVLDARRRPSASLL